VTRLLVKIVTSPSMPTNSDFYAMGCYRHLTEDRMAETLANAVIRSSIDFDGSERAPCR